MTALPRTEIPMPMPLPRLAATALTLVLPALPVLAQDFPLTIEHKLGPAHRTGTGIR